MNQNKGITLISLIVTIIVLIILASISTNVGKSLIKDAKYHNTISQMKVMQTKVNELYEEYKNGDVSDEDIGEEIPSDLSQKALQSFQMAKTNNRTEKYIGEDLTGYRYVSSDYIKNELGLEKSEFDYIVNVEYRTAILLDGVKKDDNTYYSLNEIEDEQYNVEYINPTVVLSKNGGTYIIPTNGSVSIENTLTVIDLPKDTENITLKLEYVWSFSKETAPVSGWVQTQDKSTIRLENITEEKTYYLWTKLTNIKEGSSINIENIQVSKPFVVKKASLNTYVQYAVVHSKMKLDGTGYTEFERETFRGTEYERVTPTPKTYQGYTFNEENSQSNVEINPNGTTIIELKYNLVGYTITYNLGAEDVVVENPSNYTIETESITLNTPTRDGYIFTGWTGTGLSGETETVTIPKGSTGDREYTANWREVLHPVINMKENDQNGAEYTGEWTNQNVYAELDVNYNDVNIEKYQYSIDNNTWRDIETPSEENYTFGEGTRPEYISELTDTDGTTYHFIQNGTTLTSTNQGVNSTTSKSYIKVDLSDYTEEDKLTITVNCEVSSQTSDRGYICITNSSTSPTYTTGTMVGELCKKYGTSGTYSVAADYTKTLSGGQIYYIHLGYYKNGSTHTGEDKFTVNSINFKLNNLEFKNYNKTGNKVTFNIENEINRNIKIRAVDSESINTRAISTNIKVDKTKPTANYEYNFSGEAIATIKITNINDNLSGVRGYYISTSNVAPTKNSNWVEITGTTVNIENLNKETTYYIWLIDNAGNITTNETQEIKVPNYLVNDSIYTETLQQAINLASAGQEIKLLNDYEDTSTATINKNLTLNLQNKTLTRNLVITVNSSRTLDIIGSGDITSSANRTITNSGTLNLNLTGKIKNTGTTSSYYAIYQNGGTLNVNSGNIEGYYGIYANSGTANINNGTVKGNTYGIYHSSSNSTINILGGKVEGSIYGIYGYANVSNKITIGNGETQVSSETPIILGETYGIYMRTSTYTYNFNNGIIMGTNETPYSDTIIPREGYMLYTYYDYDVYRKNCTILMPEVQNITITQTPENETWTNSNVEIQAIYPTGTGITNEFSQDGENWETITGNVYKTSISENKTIYARSLDQSGILIDSSQKQITNIDKTLPELTLSPETTTYTVQGAGNTINISVTVTISETGSGLNTAKYGWSTDKNTEPSNWENLNSGDTITKNNCSEGTYYLWFDVKDNAGNESEIKVIRYNVELQQAVAKIEGEEKYCYTLQEAIDYVSTSNKTIQIIKDTDETAVIAEGQNFILDLQGYTVGSSTASLPTITNNGTVTIIDTSSQKTGTIENLVGNAVQNNGTLTIGNNETAIEDSTPTIYGKKIGIVNAGTLNYYDGTIKGKVTVQGDVQSTPEEYGPIATYENGITTMNLRIVSDYEARIEWTYYTKVQQAIDAAGYKPYDAEAVTVTIIKNISMENGATVADHQNIRLNLNNYILTSSASSVITNNGKLEITDLSREKEGIIQGINSGASNTYNKIMYNKNELIINGGNLKTEQSAVYSIYNENGIVKVLNGKIIVNCSDTLNTYGIYNENGGTIEINGGEINVNRSNTTNNSVYAIYNKSTGIININGGLIKGNGGKYSYGLYNDNMGKIVVNGGEISINSSNNYVYGIRNNNTGTLKISGGKITSSNSSSNAAGVYNNSTGTIEISGGEISSNSSKSNAYGVYNNSVGIIEISEGKISSSSISGSSISNVSYGVCNNSTGTIEIRGGEIDSRSSSNVSYGVYNSITGTIEISGGEISSNSSRSNAYGVYNSGTGTIEINGGKITSVSNKDAYGLYNQNNNGKINIGTKDGNLNNERTPKITAINTSTGSAYGYNNKLGTINFYDGIIQGKTRFGTGGITDIEENYQIKQETLTETIDETSYELDSIYLVPQENINIVKNENTGVQYNNIQKAIEETQDNEQTTLTILQDFELKTDMCILENKNIALDLAGYTITNYYFQIINNGNLEITDSGENGKVYCNKTNVGIINKGNKTIQINGGEISVVGVIGIRNTNSGIIKIRGGKVGIEGDDNTSYLIDNASAGKIIVEGGKLCSTNNYTIYGICNSLNGEIEFNDGIIDSVGIASSSIYGIYSANGGNINIRGGTIRGKSEDDGSYPQAIYGVYSRYGVINIKEGNIYSQSKTINSYGVYIQAGTLSVGTKGDGIVNTNVPRIEAIRTGTISNTYKGYGIYNQSGNFNFYDGIISGSTRALPTDSVISEIEDNTELNWQDNDKTLTLSTEAIDLCKIGGTTYNSLQTAINAAGDSPTTLELLRGVYYTNSDSTLNIGSTQDITLDVKGFTISSAIEGPVFENNGKLKIVGTENGKIIGSNDKTIQNNLGATLELNSGTLTNTNSSSNIVYNQGTLSVTGGTITGGTNSIQNTGTANISLGTVEKVLNAGSGILNISGGTVNRGIENTESASVNVTGGNISDSTSSTRYGIKNTSTNSVNITGGTITVNRYSTNSRAYAVYSTLGTVNIGTKNSNIILEPTLIADTNAIYSENILNIYDGTLKGKASAVSGQINSLEDNSQINVTNESAYEVITLEAKATKIARVGTNEYDTLFKAVEAIGSSGTITIQRDGNVAEIIDNLSGKDITIDLNGNTLTMYNPIQNTSNLKITDSSSEEIGNLTTYKETPIYNQGNFELIKGNISSNIYGIYNQIGGTIALTGGTIKENTYGIYATAGTVNVNGGTINQNTYGTFAVGGTININSSNIQNNEYGIYTSSGTTNINGATITDNTHEVYNYAGTVNITESNITSTTRSAIENELSSGTVNVISGTITSSAGSAIENIGTGTINIGTNDGSVTGNTPTVQGETYGISNNRSGSVNFYDGAVKGKIGAILGIYLNLATGYRISTDYNDGYYIDTLKTSGTVSPVAHIGSVNYTNLQSAINACLSEEGTTIVLDNSISTEVAFEIEEDQKVTIDLNGFTISSSSAECTIKNNGELSLIDSTDTGSENPARMGTVSNTANTAIENSGTLTLGANDGNVRTKMPKIAGNTYGIKTTGTLNFYDGQISATEPLDGTVTNRPNGYIINKTTSDGISTLILGR